jgi:beta-xylosidase
MSTAEQAEGPWTPLHLVKRVKKWEDPCPFWDEDGQAYLGRSQHGAGPIIVHRMSADGRQLLDDGVTVYTGPVAEGTKFLKRNGWYYLIIPEGGVGTGWQTVLRSRHIYGPYEKRVVLEQGSTNINGPHQGALVQAVDSTWWFYHFQETPVLGRVVHLQPARWKDDWPLMGVDIDGNGIGEPVSVWTSPLPTTSPVPKMLTSDEFSDKELGLQWQWCHNPSNEHWQLSRGQLQLQALPADQLRNCRNMITQKLVGYSGEATTLLTLNGDAHSGLLCIGKQFHGVGLCAEGVYTESNGECTIVHRGHFKKVFLRLTYEVVPNQFQFFYSFDGKHYQPIGEAFSMRSGYWKGVRLGLFCYGQGGIAHFDYFRLK